MHEVWFTTLVKYSSHAWSLVYYLSEVFEPGLESFGATIDLIHRQLKVGNVGFS